MACKSIISSKHIWRETLRTKHLFSMRGKVEDVDNHLGSFVGLMDLCYLSGMAPCSPVEIATQHYHLVLFSNLYKFPSYFFSTANLGLAHATVRSAIWQRYLKPSGGKMEIRLHTLMAGLSVVWN